MTDYADPSPDEYLTALVEAGPPDDDEYATVVPIRPEPAFRTEEERQAWKRGQQPATLGADRHAASTGWDLTDLTDYVDGTRTVSPPTVGRRTDGAALFYPGRVNGLHGESEGGKTWIALTVCVEEILSAHHVLYIDYEDDPEGIVERLLALGADRASVVGYFHYVQPERVITVEAREQLTETAKLCTLVVIDACTEAMAMERLKGRDENDVAEWYERLPRWIAKLGAAVVVIDHVVKDPEARFLGAIGSQHKRAGITGVSVYAESVVRLVRGSKGRTRLYVSKDRPGRVRSEAVPSGESYWWGDFTVDATNPDALWCNIWPPTPRTEETQSDPVADTRELILTAIAKAKEPLTLNKLYARVNGKRARFDAVLAELVDGGDVLVERVGQSVIHTLAKLTGGQFAESDTADDSSQTQQNDRDSP